MMINKNVYTTVYFYVLADNYKIDAFLITEYLHEFLTVRVNMVISFVFVNYFSNCSIRLCISVLKTFQYIAIFSLY